VEKDLKRFQGKTALVTGAGSGIGRAIALRFAQESGDVIVCDIHEEHVNETARMIQDLGRTALALTGDMGSEEDVQRAAQTALGSFEHIDILVNNAGIGDTNMAYDDLDSAVWDRVYGVNVKGPFFLAQSIAKHMVDKQIQGRIISIASTEGKTNRGGSIAYASSKSALIGLTQALAVQLAPYDITVNAVCPGLVDTPIWHRGDKSMDVAEGTTIKMVVDTSIESRQLKIMRVGQPEDIAAAVTFLASGDAGYMTGQAINVCGGLEFH